MENTRNTIWLKTALTEIQEVFIGQSKAVSYSLAAFDQESQQMKTMSRTWRLHGDSRFPIESLKKGEKYLLTTVKISDGPWFFLSAVNAETGATAMDTALFRQLFNNPDFF
jgi:hypothetical protein